MELIKLKFKISDLNLGLEFVIFKLKWLRFRVYDPKLGLFELFFIIFELKGLQITVSGPKLRLWFIILKLKMLGFKIFDQKLGLGLTYLS